VATRVVPFFRRGHFLFLLGGGERYQRAKASREVVVGGTVIKWCSSTRNSVEAFRTEVFCFLFEGFALWGTLRKGGLSSKRGKWIAPALFWKAFESAGSLAILGSFVERIAPFFLRSCGCWKNQITLKWKRNCWPAALRLFLLFWFVRCRQLLECIVRCYGLLCQ